MPEQLFIPAGKFIQSLLPASILELPDIEVLDNVWMEPPFIQIDPSLDLGTALLFETPLELGIPGLDAVKLVAAPSGTQTVFILHFESEPIPKVSLVDMPVALRFNQNLLKPVRCIPGQNGEPATWVVDPDQQCVDITLAKVTLSVDFDGNVNLITNLALDMPPAMIGDTGVVIEAQNIGIYLDSNNPPPQKTTGWKGVHIGKATVHLPGGLSGTVGTLEMKNAYIGNGGFSGKVSDTWNPAPTGELFGMQFSPKHIELTFIQNTLTASIIQGEIQLPFFDSPVGVDMGINMGGGFTAALSAVQPEGVDYSNGLVTLNKSGLMSLTIESLRFELNDGVFTVALSGDFTPDIGDLDWPTFKVKELLIDSNGKVKLDGGWLDLPSIKSFDFHGFKMEISKLGFGSEEDGYRWIGLSGGIRLVEDLPMGGSFEGLKIKWKGNDLGSVKIELRGIAVQMVVPDTLALEGQVEFIDEGTLKGFKGAAKLTLIPTNVVVDAQLMIGKNSESPAYTFAYVFVAGELPAGIPLGCTGLSLYGLAGLVGYNVTPDKKPDDLWFEGWYMHDPIGVSDVTKWRPERNALAFGAGATIGTASDNGYAYHGQFLLVLLIPGPVLLIDGKSAFLTKRGGNPQLISLAVFDGRVGTFLFNVQAKYKYPDKGELLDVTAFAEAFFDFNSPRNWHLYLGLDTPEEKRVRASLLKLFEENGFLMLTHNGVRMGAWYGYDGKWKYGPLKVVLEAWVEGEAAIGWSPNQIEGWLALHGAVELKAFGFGAGLGLDAMIKARAPHPYYIHAELKVKLKTPWPLPDPKATIDLTWKEELPPPTPLPLEVLGLEHLKVTEKWIMGKNPDNVPIVPLDAKPILSFQRSMFDHTGLASDWLPPTAEKVGHFLFRYHLDQIQFKKQPPSSYEWVDVTTPVDPSLPSGKLWGMWQAIPSSIGEGGGVQDVPPMTKLMLWSRTPFDYGRETTNTAVEDGFLDSNPNWPCGYDWTPAWLSADFEDRIPGSMPSISSAGDLTVIAIGAQIKAWANDWLPATRAACIGDEKRSQSQNKGKNDNEIEWSPFDDPYLAQKFGGLLRIFFPPNTAAARLCVGRGTNGWFRIPGRDKEILQATSLEIEVIPTSGDLVYLDLTGTVHLLRIDWIDKTEWERMQAGKKAKKTLCSAALGADPEILEPHTQYWLTVNTHVERSSNGGGSWETVGTFSDEGFFRTESPPGLRGIVSGGELEPNDSSEHYPDRGPLHDLRPYVLVTSPLDGAQPVYRSYDIGVEFNEPYTEMLYLLDGKPLILQIRDVNGVPILDSEGKPDLNLNQWASVAAAQGVSRAENTWINALNQLSCANLENTNLPEPKGLWIRHPRVLLAPQMIHRAVTGAVVPTAVIPLQVDGSIVLDSNNEAKCVSLSGNNSVDLGLIKAIESSRKLVITNNAVLETGLGAQGDAKSFDVARPDQAQLLKAVLKNINLQPSNVSRIFDWSFTTSRFASFVHHLHSWSGVVHDIHAELGSPANALLKLEDLIKLQERLLEINIQREDEAQYFDDAVSFFGLDISQLPAIVTITLLRDAGRSYGLLVESPEPLPSNRVTFTIEHHVTCIDLVSSPLSVAKLNAVGFAETDNPEDLVKEYVDLVLMGSTSLNGMCILASNDGSNWQEYYKFTSADRFPEGTVIRVHTGAAISDTSRDPELEHFYSQDSGGSATRKFTASTVQIRLVDAQNSLIHERLFLKDGFMDQEFQVLRSRDDTRMLLFFKDETSVVGNVPTGTLRISWQYLRNVSNIQRSEPVLRRLGSDFPENVILDLPISYPIRSRRKRRQNVRDRKSKRST
jgi:hypothetical protein